VLKKLSIAAALLTVSATSQAVSVDMSFSGVITEGSLSSCIDEEAGICNDWSNIALANTAFHNDVDFSVGNSFSGITNMHFDGTPGTVDIFDDYAYYGGWEDLEGWKGFSASSQFEVGSEQSSNPAFSNLESDMAVVTNADDYDVFSVTQVGILDDWSVLVSLDLFDFGATMLDDLSLPTDIELTDNSLNTFSITFMNNLSQDQYRFSGELDNFAMTSTSVAAPATNIVFASALFALMAFRRKTSV